MIVKQISVFLENKAGRINELTKTLGGAGINMQAFCISDSSEFGIMRIVISGDAAEATAVLRSNGYTSKVTDVIALECADEPGSMSAIMERLATEGVFIEYMYAYADGGVARVIIRPNDLEKCIAILEK